jgi:hypothetical protein
MPDHHIARTAQGSVEGNASEGVVRFREIPFAAPIFGQTRFARLQACRQELGADGPAGSRPNCRGERLVPPLPVRAILRSADFEGRLCLNLWTPSLEQTKRPMMSGCTAASQQAWRPARARKPRTGREHNRNIWRWTTASASPSIPLWSSGSPAGSARRRPGAYAFYGRPDKTLIDVKSRWAMPTLGRSLSRSRRPQPETASGRGASQIGRPERSRPAPKCAPRCWSVRFRP